MFLGGSVYAARRFYFIGKSGATIPYDENAKHLRQELVRQCIAEQCLGKFNAGIVENSINTAGKSALVFHESPFHTLLIHT